MGQTLTGHQNGFRLDLILVLRQSVGDGVIIALIGDIDMMRQSYIGGGVERAHGDGNASPRWRVPKQERAARPAKAAPNFFGRLVPADVLLTLHRYAVAWDVGRGPIMAALLAALVTMASIGRGQRARYGYVHRSAKAGGVMALRPRHGQIIPTAFPAASNRAKMS